MIAVTVHYPTSYRHGWRAFELTEKEYEMLLAVLVEHRWRKRREESLKEVSIEQSRDKEMFDGTEGVDCSCPPVGWGCEKCIPHILEVVQDVFR